LNPRQPKLLLALALALFAYIAVYERPTQSDAVDPPEATLLPGVNAAAVNRVEYQSGNSVLAAELRNHRWRLVAPKPYPANETAIQALLRSCADLKSRVAVPTDEIDNLSDFGLRPPKGKLTVFQGATRLVLSIGAATPANNGLYVQASDSDSIDVIDAKLLELLPTNAALWRSPHLLDLAEARFDRVRIRNRNNLLVLERGTNRVWSILQPPPPKRGDSARLEQLIEVWKQWRVAGFVTDDPGVSLEAFGLDRPQLELSFAQGTNDVLSVQFGNSPTNLPGTIYARLPASGNIVLATDQFIPILREGYWTFCDKRMIDPLKDADFDIVEVRGPESFTLQRQTNQLWRSVDTNGIAADPALMFHFLTQLQAVEAVEIAREVVTDYSEYGLDKPALSYQLHQSSTNAAGQITNRLVAGIDLGKSLVDRTFVRRHDENAVYVVPSGRLASLPKALYEIRSRILWAFDTNNVASITLFEDGRTNTLTRATTLNWTRDTTGTPQALDLVESAAVEEGLTRLSLLQAEAWVTRGAPRLPTYDITARSRGLSINLKAPAGRQHTLLFGRMPRGRNCYAAYRDLVDGQWIVFEFERRLFEEYVYPYFSVKQ
jgi:hypothetical protein